MEKPTLNRRLRQKTPAYDYFSHQIKYVNFSLYIVGAAHPNQSGCIITQSVQKVYSEFGKTFLNESEENTDKCPKTRHCVIKTFFENGR